MGLVLDTSALIDLERMGGEWIDQLGNLAEEAVALPAIVCAELMAGVALAGNTRRAIRRKARVDALVASVGIVPFDQETAAEWANLFAVLSKRGKMIPANDLAVAATAKQLGFGVLVGVDDERHFRQIPRLDVRTL